MEKNELRKFGLILGTVSVGWGAWWLKNGSAASIYFLAAALMLWLSALLYPLGLKPVFVFWTKLGTIFNWITTRIILTLIFYLVLTPIGWWLRLTGKDLLNLKIQPKASSYWQTSAESVDKKQLTKQY